MIYDLDNKGGGRIIGESSDTLDKAALVVTSFSVGKGGIAILSTASGAPIEAKTFGVSSKFESSLTAVKPALEVNSYAPGYDALSILSTASGYPLNVVGITGDYGARFRSNVTGGRAIIIGKIPTGSPTIAPVLVQHPSCASAPLLGFGGGFISCTSVVLTTVANADYVIPVSLNGVVRYIPCFGSGAIVGGAAF